MALDREARLAKRKATYPPNHRPAMEVPRGGSSCATCEYYVRTKSAEDHCRNKHFIQWKGTSKLPLPADQYCSDWYEPAKGAL